MVTESDDASLISTLHNRSVEKSEPYPESQHGLDE